MFDNVAPFPSKSIRDWNKTSKMMKDMILSLGVSESVATEFVTLFKPTYDTFQFSHPMSFTSLNEETEAMIKNEIDKFTSALQEHTSKLLFERFAREFEIFYFYKKR